MGVDVVKDAMRRNRFEKSVRYIHLADNTKINEDRLFMVREVYDILNKNFKVISNPKRMSVDETMIPYYEKHSAKKFIRGKRIRFGFKLWGIADPDDGWLLHVGPCCGSSTRPTTKHGQGGNVVLGLLDAIQAEPGTEATFDHLFTSRGLLEDLGDRGIKATGTLRENRVSKDMNMASKKEAAKNARGSMDYRVSPDGRLLVVRWTYNAPVTVLSNFRGIGAPAWKSSTSTGDRVTVDDGTVPDQLT